MNLGRVLCRGLHLAVLLYQKRCTMLRNPKHLVCCSIQIPGETLNKDAWLKGKVLRVGDSVFDLIVNPPTLQKVRRPADLLPFVTLPSRHNCKMQHGNCIVYKHLSEQVMLLLKQE